MGSPVTLVGIDGVSAPTLPVSSTTLATSANQAVNVDATSFFMASLVLGANNSTDFTNNSARGVIISVGVDSSTGTSPTITIAVQGKDGWGHYYTIFTSSAISGATAVTALTIYPGVTVSANVAMSAPLPRTWRIIATLGGTTPTFSGGVGYSYII